MSMIGGIWLKSIQLLDGEVVRYSVLSNRSQSTIRAVGGKLFLTNKRLIFTPHIIDMLLRGKEWSVNCEDIIAIGSREAGGDIFGGGLRARLAIEHKGGIDLFVVNNLEQVITRLRQELAQKRRIGHP